MNFLAGKKTYILAGLGLIIMLCAFFGIVSWDTAVKILGLLGIGSIATLRQAIS